MNWRAILTHRFVYVPAGLAIAVGAWNLYVAANADGVIEGTVRDAAGRPVAGADVIFFERNIVNNQEKFRARTDEAEQRRRFEKVNTARAADGRPALPLPESLLAALESIPDCTGVALGFDRLAMLAAGANSIDEVLAVETE